eukprot:1157346-Pelagomonas_calceolata.AAC.2
MPKNLQLSVLPSQAQTMYLITDCRKLMSQLNEHIHRHAVCVFSGCTEATNSGLAYAHHTKPSRVLPLAVELGHLIHIASIGAGFLAKPLLLKRSLTWESDWHNKGLWRQPQPLSQHRNSAKYSKDGRKMSGTVRPGCHGMELNRKPHIHKNWLENFADIACAATE